MARLQPGQQDTRILLSWRKNLQKGGRERKDRGEREAEVHYADRPAITPLLLGMTNQDMPAEENSTGELHYKIIIIQRNTRRIGAMLKSPDGKNSCLLSQHFEFSNLIC